ncbi:FAD-dependent oxidoreductase [Sphingomonas sp. M6A6_1c]
MILDLRKDDLPTVAAFPVLIIGGGPAGIALALELERRGVDVLLVEAGGNRINSDGQDIYRAEAIGEAGHGPIHRFRHRALGGTSAVWGGRCIPLDPIDLEARPWLSHARWPIEYADLARHYPAALQLCRAGAPVFSAIRTPEHDGGGAMFDMTDDDLVLDRIERFSEPTHFGRQYRDRLRHSDRITVVTNAPVIRIRAHDGGDRVAGVDIHMPDGGERSVLADVVIVAVGAIETARLLLSSTTEKPCGLGNERDLVGRFYQCHLEGHFGELVLTPGTPARLDYFRDAEGIYCRRYMWLSPAAQRRNHLAGLILRATHAKVADPAHGDPVLSAMFLVKGMLVPEYARGMNSTEHAEARRIGGSAGVYTRHAINVLRGSPQLAGFATDWTRRRVLARRKLPSVFLSDPRGRYPLDVNAEQSPNPDSRIRLGDARDDLGQRRVIVDWCASADDRHRVARGVAIAGDALKRAGVACILIPTPHLTAAALTPVGGHHIGTARMAETAATGVVDHHGEAFACGGLYIAGAASFPTSGFANPTLTIVALALRMAERVAARLAAPTS